MDLEWIWAFHRRCHQFEHSSVFLQIAFFFGGAAVVHAKKAEKSGKLTRKNQVPISERLATLQLGWLKENESQESQEIPEK